MRMYATLGCGLMLLVALLSGCQKQTNEPDEILFWQRAFLPGNFRINDTGLALQKDASTTDHTMDYVLKEALPDTVFKTYAIKLYVPNDPDVFQVVADSVVVWVNTGTGKRRLPFTVEQGVSGNNTEKYSVFAITAEDSAGQGNPDNFTTLTFSLYCHYVNRSDQATKASRNVVADIYKKD